MLQLIIPQTTNGLHSLQRKREKKPSDRNVKLDVLVFNISSRCCCCCSRCPISTLHTRLTQMQRKHTPINCKWGTLSKTPINHTTNISLSLSPFDFYCVAKGIVRVWVNEPNQITTTI